MYDGEYCLVGTAEHKNLLMGRPLENQFEPSSSEGKTTLVNEPLAAPETPDWGDVGREVPNRGSAWHSRRGGQSSFDDVVSRVRLDCPGRDTAQSRTRSLKVLWDEAIGFGNDVQFGYRSRIGSQGSSHVLSTASFELCCRLGWRTLHLRYGKSSPAFNLQGK